MAWSADSTRIATGSDDGTARVWSMAEDTHPEPLTLAARGTITSVWDVAFSPDGQRLIAGDTAIGAATVFDIGLTGDAEVLNLPAPPAWTGVDFYPDGGSLAASSENVTATVRDVSTGRVVGRTGTHGAQDDPDTGTHVYDVAVSPDGGLLATASDASVKVWDAATLKEVLAYRPGLGVGDISWTADGSVLAVAGSQDGVTPILDRTGHVVGRVREDPGWYSLSAAFSPDGSLLATGRDVAAGAPRLGRYGVTIRDWRTGATVATVDALAEALAFAPDGKSIATADPTGPAQLWNASTGQLLATLGGQAGGAFDITFSPDGTTLVTAGQDGTIRLWDARTGEQRIALYGHRSAAYTVRFSPDATKLASTSADGVVRVWALDIDDLLALARHNVTRSLTATECGQYLHLDTCP